MRLKQKPKTFEFLVATLKGQRLVQFVVIYRPPPSKRNKFKTSEFLDEFEQLARELVLLSGELFILGDFNLHLDDTGDSTVRKFEHMLESLNLKQHVTTTTQKHGHILDLIITRASDSTMVEDSVTVDTLSFQTSQITIRSSVPSTWHLPNQSVLSACVASSIRWTSVPLPLTCQKVCLQSLVTLSMESLVPTNVLCWM